MRFLQKLDSVEVVSPGYTEREYSETDLDLACSDLEAHVFEEEVFSGGTHIWRIIIEISASRSETLAATEGVSFRSIFDTLRF